MRKEISVQKAAKKNKKSLAYPPYRTSKFFWLFARSMIAFQLWSNGSAGAARGGGAVAIALPRISFKSTGTN